MTSQITIHLGAGSLANGYNHVVIDLNIDSKLSRKDSSLSPSINLQEAYCQWYNVYQAYYPNCRSSTIEDDQDPDFIDSSGINNIGNDTAHELNILSDNLIEKFNHWLNIENRSFYDSIVDIEANLNFKKTINIIVEVEDEQMKKLPWEWWDLVQKPANAGISLANLSNKNLDRIKNKTKKKISLLGILGDNTNIDTDHDRENIEARSDIKSQFLKLSSIEELDDKLRQNSWDILFYSGHSQQGLIKINSSQSLDIKHLRYTLKDAITKGLSLAIFNCCWGLELASKIKDLNLPAIIIMREEVPNAVAQKFLKYFIDEFSQGISLDIALRNTQRRLKQDQERFPGAYFIAMLVRNSSEKLPTWRYPFIPWWQTLGKVAGVSAIATSLIFGMRWLGYLEALELKTFDWLMQQRPAESSIDKRLLVVEIDKDDINQHGYPLPDNILAQLLEKLSSYHPRAIGLDMHRYQPRGEGRSDLIRRFTDNHNLITVCAFGSSEQPYNPPPELLTQPNPNNQLGFSNLLQDKDTNIIRRQLLSYNPQKNSSPSNCSTPYSLSLQLASRFLEAEKVTPLKVNKDQDWQLGKIILKRLPSRFGGYQNLGGASSQIMINYHTGKLPGQHISLEAVLRNSLNPEMIRDRIILIGYNSSVANDEFNTPMGKRVGVWIHAEMTSQLLSTVLDRRPLIWVLPQWGDALIVFFGWTASGFLLLLWQQRSALQVAIVLCVSTLSVPITLILLYQISLFALQEGLWLPLIPAMLSGLIIFVFLIKFIEFHQKRS